MSFPEEFEIAGEVSGLQIWRVESMKLNLAPKKTHGEFYSGDSYIILKTFAGLEYNVHSWIGEEASPDERGCAAIFMVQLDDYLKGQARQFTEFQGDESTIFMSYFPCGIRYKEGGIASGFKLVAPEEIKRLLHLKGRRNVRATEVTMDWASFNSGDCFLIDLGETIYHWSGKGCNPFERIKTTDMAIEIRDEERAGSPEIIFVEEGEEPEEIIKLLGPKPELPAKTLEDTSIDVRNKNVASLYLISDAAGKMKTTLLAERNPFKQEMLSNKDCYILDNSGNKTIFVWKGKEANSDERRAAYEAAKTFIKEKNYPENTKVNIMPSGAEISLFKQFFVNWVDKYETTCLTPLKITSRIAKVEQVPFDASVLHEDKVMAAQHGMVDDGSGKVQIWRVEKGDKAAVDESLYGHFYGGDSYLVQYSYPDNDKTKHIIYIWQGQKSTLDEKGASAILAVNLDQSLGGAATLVRVTQGQEPPHLVSLFKGKSLVIHLGGTSRRGGDTKPASIRLFHIRRSSTKATWAVEVEPSSLSLNSNDVFILKKNDSVKMWVGKGATPEELEAAEYVATLLGGSVTKEMETQETAAFWTALGGKKPYPTSLSLQNTINIPRLFACSNASGKLIAEEVTEELTQMALATNDVMILDCTDQLFIWIGNDANETEKTGAPKIAEDYLKYDPSGRRGIPITTIKQGEEPLTFIGWFHTWDPKRWNKSALECMQERIKKH